MPHETCGAATEHFELDRRRRVGWLFLVLLLQPYVDVCWAVLRLDLFDLESARVGSYQGGELSASVGPGIKAGVELPESASHSAEKCPTVVLDCHFEGPFQKL